MTLKEEITRRRTFAIISHPDAGKTTLTEKLLLFGGAIHVAGAVKSNKIKKTATSDFMEIERQRGISVATSVMGFEYEGCKINILDTPGHEDFAEDTYRTLTAVDSVIIVIDGAKGVETQTRRLMNVCRMRSTPVMVFINKFDRPAKDPFDLLDEVEQELDIKVRPLAFPISDGPTFKGVYNLYENNLSLFLTDEKLTADAKAVDIKLDSPELESYIGQYAKRLREDVELIDVAVYTQQALEAMSQMAAELGEPAALVSAYREKADTLKKRINTLFWDDSEGLYGDFFGSKEQMLNVCKGAMHQLETYRREGFEVSEDKISYYKKLAEKAAREKDHTQRCWFSNKNWVISTPLEVGIAPRERALDQLDKVREYHCSEFGPYLSAVERLRNMTIATGVQAVAEARYGRIEESVAYMRMIGSTLGRTLPGSINEMMPDYGCPAQAWTIYGIAVPILSELFGINPHASKKVVVLQPNIPEGWDELSVDNLAIGTNTLHYELKQTDKEISIILRDSEPGWTYRIDESFLGGRTLHVDHATLPCH